MIGRSIEVSTIEEEGIVSKGCIRLAEFDEAVLGSGTDLKGLLRITDDPDIDENHCCLSLEENGELWFTDISKNNQCFLQLPTNGSATITTQRFKLGYVTFQISSRKDLLITNKERLRKVRIKSDEFYISRGNEKGYSNVIDIGDELESISSMHALLKYNPVSKSWEIKDHGRRGTGSLNGTYVEIGPRTIVVEPGSTIFIGSSTFLTC